MDIDKAFEMVSRQADKALSAGEEEITRRYREILRELRKEVGAAYNKHGKAGKLTYDVMGKYGRAEKMTDGIAKNLRQKLVPVASDTRAYLRQTASEMFEGTMDTVGQAAGRKLRGELSTDKIKEIIQTPHSGMELNDRLARNRALIVDRIQETITQGMVRGENYRTMTANLKGDLEGDITKAVRIIRTEGHRVQEGARYRALERAQAQGVEQLKWWETMEDADVRPGHQDMGVRYNKAGAIPLDQEFINHTTGGRGLHPGKLGRPEDDINCRCQTRIVIVGLK